MPIGNAVIVGSPGSPTARVKLEAQRSGLLVFPASTRQPNFARFASHLRRFEVWSSNRPVAAGTFPALSAFQPGAFADPVADLKKDSYGYEWLHLKTLSL
jgi:hypothetical protein